MKLKIKDLIIITFLLVTNCLAQPSGPYFGQEPPGMTPQVFAPGFICLDNRFEQNITFSPDGTECYFSETNNNWNQFFIWESKQQDGIWTEPIKSAFSGNGDTEPMFPPNDPNRLFFVGCRPVVPPYNTEIYFMERTTTGWGNPIKLPEPINSSSREWHCSFTNDGTMYFLSRREEQTHQGEIYRAQLVEGEYLSIERLAYPINTTYQDGDPTITPDESYLIFTSQRPGGFGNSDLYISLRNPDDSWTPPRNLGPNINSSGFEMGSSISPDGNIFFFTRRDAYLNATNSDIYWVNIRAVLPDPNGPIENVSSGLHFGSIQCAINYAESGDTIVIEPGIYLENIILDKDLILQSVDPNDPYYVGGTIIKGDLQNTVLTLTGNTAACEINGLTIRAGSVGITGTATSATIRNCRIIDNAIHGIELFELSSPTLKNCLITANGQTGIMMHEAMSRGNPPCEPVIENCIIVDNGQTAIDGGEPVIVDSIID